MVVGVEVAISWVSILSIPRGMAAINVLTVQRSLVVIIITGCFTIYITTLAILSIDHTPTHAARTTIANTTNHEPIAGIGHDRWGALVVYHMLVVDPKVIKTIY